MEVLALQIMQDTDHCVPSLGFTPSLADEDAWMEGARAALMAPSPLKTYPNFTQMPTNISFPVSYSLPSPSMHTSNAAYPGAPNINANYMGLAVLQRMSEEEQDNSSQFTGMSCDELMDLVQTLKKGDLPIDSLVSPTIPIPQAGAQLDLGYPHFQECAAYPLAPMQSTFCSTSLSNISEGPAVTASNAPTASAFDLFTINGLVYPNNAYTAHNNHIKASNIAAPCITEASTSNVYPPTVSPSSIPISNGCAVSMVAKPVSLDSKVPTVVREDVASDSSSAESEQDWDTIDEDTGSTNLDLGRSTSSDGLGDVNQARVHCSRHHRYTLPEDWAQGPHTPPRICRAPNNDKATTSAERRRIRRACMHTALLREHELCTAAVSRITQVSKACVQAMMKRKGLQLSETVLAAFTASVQRELEPIPHVAFRE